MNASGNSDERFSGDALAQQLFAELGVQSSGTFFVAYSGGVDSTVLLHAMCELRDKYQFSLVALHVDHNLQQDSRDWAQHCETVCADLGVSLISTRLVLPDASEATARTARYQWFSEQVGRGNVLLTAHHRQDRAETFLFNLLRGAGSAGLSSLRAQRAFYGSTLLRPMLKFAQREVTDYAIRAGLQWVEDASNRNVEYSRNYIRQHVLPAMASFRSDAERNIARAAANLEQENSLLREIAISDLVECREYPRHPVDQSHAINFEDMLHLSEARQGNLLRFWLYSLQLHTPSKRLLENLLNAIKNPPASTAVMQEDGVQFRLYRGFLYVMPALAEEQAFQAVDWRNIDQPINLYQQKIRIDATSKLREFCHSRAQSHLRLVARPNLVNPRAIQGHSLNLKTWLQEQGVPPWRRQSLPLLTLRQADSDLVLGPVDQQFQNDWVSMDCPLAS